LAVLEQFTHHSATEFNESYTGVPFHSTSVAGCGKAFPMAKLDEAKSLSWPWWAPWALLGVIVSLIATIAATLYDIL
jgi:hypothetical protein